MNLASHSMHRGEVLLLAGLALWAAAFAPAFPIVWIIAQMSIGPVALLLLILGAWRARDGAAPALRQVFGVALLLLGLGALYVSSLQTMILANHLFPPKATASTLPVDAWARALAIWFAPAIFWAFGLRAWTSWPVRRCLGWAAIVFAVHLAAFAGFWLLLQTDPVRTA